VDNLRLRMLRSGKSAGTTKNALELLRRIINFGVKKGLCSWQNPSRLHFEMPKLNNVKTEMLNEEERKRFLEAIETAPNRKVANLMLMAYYTGMRRNELFGLKWEHIDFENGFINIVGERQEGAKSNRDERIPLSQLVRELLGKVEHGEGPYVFPGRDGKSRLTDVSNQVNTIKKAANLPKDFRPLHGLRHTFASVAVSNGVPLSHVQKLLTHKDPTLTQRYAHLEDGALKRSAQVVGNLLEISATDDSITLDSVNTPEAYAICSDIWLQASIVAHPFIEREFWKNNQRAMTEQYLPASQVCIAYEEGIPVGFTATHGNTLEALFVLPTRWKSGIGRRLINQLFSEHEELQLTVYQKNQRAIAFYQRMGFITGRQQECQHTGEVELLMSWKRNGKRSAR
jgi:integrase/GNAT superfamily N-acetyltransferase